ncbi:unnamed protein product [Chrysoparadoxa australica]
MGDDLGGDWAQSPLRAGEAESEVEAEIESESEGKKRGRDIALNDDEQQRKEKKRQKTKQMKAKLKQKKREKSTLEAAAALGQENGSGAGSGPLDEDPSDVLWACIAKSMAGVMTPLELTSPWLELEHMCQVPSFGAHTLPKLPGYIKSVMPEWSSFVTRKNTGKGLKQAPGTAAVKGSPPVIVVCSGARRCMEVIKALATFRCSVLKLFAKHMNVEEQAKMLRKSKFSLAVGTPGRIKRLAETGALSLKATQLLVLDLEKNVKGFSVLDIKGVAEDLCGMLADYVKPELGHLKIALY